MNAVCVVHFGDLEPRGNVTKRCGPVSTAHAGSDHVDAVTPADARNSRGAQPNRWLNSLARYCAVEKLHCDDTSVMLRS